MNSNPLLSTVTLGFFPLPVNTKKSIEPFVLVLFIKQNQNLFLLPLVKTQSHSSASQKENGARRGGPGMDL